MWCVPRNTVRKIVICLPVIDYLDYVVYIIYAPVRGVVRSIWNKSAVGRATWLLLDHPRGLTWYLSGKMSNTTRQYSVMASTYVVHNVFDALRVLGIFVLPGLNSNVTAWPEDACDKLFAAITMTVFSISSHRTQTHYVTLPRTQRCKQLIWLIRWPRPGFLHRTPGFLHRTPGFLHRTPCRICSWIRSSRQKRIQTTNNQLEIKKLFIYAQKKMHNQVPKNQTLQCNYLITISLQL